MRRWKEFVSMLEAVQAVNRESLRSPRQPAEQNKHSNRHRNDIHDNLFQLSIIHGHHAHSTQEHRSRTDRNISDENELKRKKKAVLAKCNRKGDPAQRNHENKTQDAKDSRHIWKLQTASDQKSANNNDINRNDNQRQKDSPRNREIDGQKSQKQSIKNQESSSLVTTDQSQSSSKNISSGQTKPSDTHKLVKPSKV